MAESGDLSRDRKEGGRERGKEKTGRDRERSKRERKKEKETRRLHEEEEKKEKEEVEAGLSATARTSGEGAHAVPASELEQPARREKSVGARVSDDR